MISATRTPRSRALPTAREYVARQYEREGKPGLAERIRRGDYPSDSILRAIRAVQAAQQDAITEAAGS